VDATVGGETVVQVGMALDELPVYRRTGKPGEIPPEYEDVTEEADSERSPVGAEGGGGGGGGGTGVS